MLVLFWNLHLALNFISCAPAQSCGWVVCSPVTGSLLVLQCGIAECYHTLSKKWGPSLVPIPCPRWYFPSWVLSLNTWADNNKNLETTHAFPACCSLCCSRLSGPRILRLTRGIASFQKDAGPRPPQTSHPTTPDKTFSTVAHRKID